MKIRKSLGRQHDGYQVETFVEKLNLEDASKYTNSDNWLWNSGMFMFRASVWIESIGKYRADILKACEVAYSKGTKDG